MNNAKRFKIINILNTKNPFPKSELNFNSDFELLISVMLSAQTKDHSVNNITNILYPIANTPEKFIKLGIFKLKNYLKNIGLYNKKAENIINISKIFIKKKWRFVPNKRSFLESLPGVGRKTTNVILSTLYKINTIAVDTHVFRVSNRSHFALGKNVKIVEKKLMKVVPKKYIHKIHHWFVLHGRYVCKSKNPICNQCCIKYYCEYEKNK
ncbi:endonuclease III [Buchnera aphidicola]|uniref:Endonuclease III n=1 Tax=Buchnera aphidicola (Anoecia oenotherae) TaxID=1241833 RepID=A0A4D6XUR4_9GAMM|nr:endonuclease III [Buchnera aphidicola]QCI19229.1 endonuclease III [Buchnera aphidicola (Anoecia oenotherae)]